MAPDTVALRRVGGMVSRDGGQPFGVGAARRPPHEDAISLGDDAQHLEADIGEGRHEALMVGDAPALVQGEGNAGVFGGEVIRKVPRPQGKVAGVERLDQAERDLLVLFDRHGKKPPFARITAGWMVPSVMAPTEGHRIHAGRGLRTAQTRSSHRSCLPGTSGSGFRGHRTARRVVRRSLEKPGVVQGL
jgi:hypothetical protein